MALPNYCDAPQSQGASGKDIKLFIFPASPAPGEEDKPIAVGGEQGLSINESRDTSEMLTKDSGGWKDFSAGMAEYTIDHDGLYLQDDAGQNEYRRKFRAGEYICWVIADVTDAANVIYLFGGLGIGTDNTTEFPSDDASTMSLSIQGTGRVHDLVAEADTETEQPAEPGTGDTVGTEG